MCPSVAGICISLIQWTPASVLALHLYNCGVHSMFRENRYTAEINKFITTSYWPKTGQHKYGDQYPLRLAIDLMIIANNLYELLSSYGIKRSDLHHWSEKCSSSNTFTVTSCSVWPSAKKNTDRQPKCTIVQRKLVICHEENQTVCITEKDKTKNPQTHNNNT